MRRRHARCRRRTFSQRTQGTRPLPPRSSSSTPQSLRVLVQRLPNFPDEWTLPEYGTDGSAAVDLRNAGETIVLPPLGRHLVPTGLAIALPEWTEAQIRPRSGLALKRGISIINTPCTIDSDYRGEIRIPLINFDREPQEIAHGERIAQMLIAQVIRIEWEPADELPPTGRGSGGFGSTGRH
ncbi:MAG: dUTP diphosphatase [Candidatus Cloacimonetes bacterium]|nr:dUTP diphosphatase [Candidatus Cloacimonadota bacterium]